MQNNLSKIIIIILVVTLAIVSTTVTILYAKTDLLKSKDILFKKYLAQNVEFFSDILDLSSEEEFAKIIKENDYTDKMETKIKYTENEGDEEEVYSIKERGAINNKENAEYRKFDVSYGNEDLMQIEFAKQNNMVGFRLPNLVRQFVSVENSNLSYLISSMGYQGKYFSDKINMVDLSSVFTFTDEEIQELKATYMQEIFKDLDKKAFTIKRNSLITLSNDDSITTTAYVLKVNRNDLDKIYKRILNTAINDKIIIGKIDELSQRLENAGFKEQEGQTLKERYSKLLQQKIESLEYTGQDKTEITIKVYQTKGNTVRTEIATEEKKMTMDLLDIEHGKEITLKVEQYTEEGTDQTNYAINKEIENGIVKRNVFCKMADKETIQFGTKISNKENSEISIEGYLDYSGQNYHSINAEVNDSIKIGDSKKIPEIFTENSNVPNIILNNYDGDDIINILNNLKEKQISSLAEKQEVLSTKMLKNILLWLDEKQKEADKEQQNNEERKKQRFNNKFELYAGENLTHEHVKRLINVVSSNMKDYKAANGKLAIYIENGTKNEQKAEEILKAINDKHTYNVEMKYAENGYIAGIIISAYKKN